MASPAPKSKTRQKYTPEVEMDMWEFFMKKLRRNNPEAIESRYTLWQEYAKLHAERTWQNYDSHFREIMLPRLDRYALDKEDMLLVLKKCRVTLDQRQVQKKELERGLNCKLQVDKKGNVLSCVTPEDHAEQDGQDEDDGPDTDDGSDVDDGPDTDDESDTDNGPDTDDGSDADDEGSSETSKGSQADVSEVNNEIDPADMNLLDDGGNDESLHLDLSGEEPQETAGTPGPQSPTNAPTTLGMQSAIAVPLQPSSSSSAAQGDVMSAVQASSSSSAASPPADDSVALPVIQPGMSYEEQNEICRQRMVLILEKKLPASTFLQGVTEPVRSEVLPLVDMLRAVLKPKEGNYDPGTTETGWLSSRPPRKVPRKAKKSS